MSPRRCLCSRRPASDVRSAGQSSAFHRKAATAIALRYAHPASVLTAEVKSIGYSNRAGRVHMKAMARVSSPARAGSFALALLAAFGLSAARAQNRWEEGRVGKEGGA